MSNLVPGFQLFSGFILNRFEMAKLASSRRVENSSSYNKTTAKVFSPQHLFSMIKDYLNSPSQVSGPFLYPLGDGHFTCGIA